MLHFQRTSLQDAEGPAPDCRVAGVSISHRGPVFWFLNYLVKVIFFFPVRNILVFFFFSAKEVKNLKSLDPVATFGVACLK